MSKYDEEHRFKREAMMKTQAIKQAEEQITKNQQIAADTEKSERIARIKAQNQEDYLRQYERQIKESKKLQEEYEEKRLNMDSFQ